MLSLSYDNSFSGHVQYYLRVQTVEEIGGVRNLVRQKLHHVHMYVFLLSQLMDVHTDL